MPADWGAAAAAQDSEGDPSESEAPSEAAAGAGFMSERQAAVELFLRLNHARQIVDFVKRQARAALRPCCRWPLSAPPCRCGAPVPGRLRALDSLECCASIPSIKQP